MSYRRGIAIAQQPAVRDVSGPGKGPFHHSCTQFMESRARGASVQAERTPNQLSSLALTLGIQASIPPGTHDADIHGG